jgi:membrane-associated phospholipid phosphatase
VTAIGLVVVLVPPTARRWRWTIIAAVFATAMAMSRTYLGAHWASDVVAGAAIGTGWAVTWSAALEIARDRWQRRDGDDADARGDDDVARGGGDDGAAPAPGRARRRVRAIGAASVVLSLGALVGIVLLHVLRRDLPPMSHRISEYAIGPHGGLMAASFVCIGAALLLLAAGLPLIGGRGPALVGAVVAVAGTGMVIAAFYRTDPERSGRTEDAIHSASSGLATISLITAAVAWSILGPRWGRVERHPLLTLLALAAVVLGVASPFLHRTAVSGASQRSLWAALLVWVIAAAWQLTSEPGRQLSAASAPSPTIDA